MLRQLINWRTGLALVAVAIVIGTIFYSNLLAQKIEKEEREKISQWVEANKFIASSGENANLNLAVQIQQQNADIPIIQTNEKDSIIDSRNLDSISIKTDKSFLQKKLKEFKTAHPPIVLVLNQEPYVADKYYYGDSLLLKQVKYYPSVQLIIVALFILITLYAISARNKSTQNQVWAGMAKETAHQLGTPISSLEGWVEMLKEKNEDAISSEMEKDLQRLKLISDRFGKIGSSPKLEEANLTEQVEKMVSYIKRRASEKVNFQIDAPTDFPVIAKISGPLIDWVIENLLKNALDAMEGRGKITVKIWQRSKQIIVDVSDTGKGISKQNLSKVFKPGFTTKKRGWGLGLSLSKRIIEQYHQGQLSVKSSEAGKGTTFRIILNN